MSFRVRAEPMLRPLMQAWWRMRRPMTMGVRALVENGDGHVLLVRHTYVDGWFFPGGGIERGETAQDALAKELAEEAGIAATEPPVLFGVYSNEQVFRGDHVLLYQVRAWRPCGGEKAGEIAETGWFDPAQPPAGITAATHRRLREVFFGEVQTATW